MSDWLNVGVRFALYIDLTLFFGLPLFIFYNFESEQRFVKNALKLDSLLAVIASVGVLLSACSMVLLAKSMSGAARFADLNQDIFVVIIASTNAGLACAVRIMTLFLALLCLLFLKRWRPPTLIWIIAFAAVALATLAWDGHGAMNEGARGYVHLIADMLHLIAAGAWVGALAAFLLLLLPSKHSPCNQIQLLSHALSAFAVIGTSIVITLAITGVVSYWFIMGPNLAGLVSSTYGILLLIKLGLFVAMLGSAFANRYHLSPLLEQAITRGDHASAAASLRRSLSIETGAAVLILLLVAWLGTLDPSKSM